MRWQDKLTALERRHMRQELKTNKITLAKFVAKRRETTVLKGCHACRLIALRLGLE